MTSDLGYTEACLSTLNLCLPHFLSKKKIFLLINLFGWYIIFLLNWRKTGFLNVKGSIFTMYRLNLQIHHTLHHSPGVHPIIAEGFLLYTFKPLMYELNPRFLYIFPIWKMQKICALETAQPQPDEGHVCQTSATSVLTAKCKTHLLLGYHQSLLLI